MSVRHVAEKLLESMPRLKTELKVKEKILDKQTKRHTQSERVTGILIVIGLISIFISFRESIPWGIFVLLFLVWILFIFYAIINTLKEKEENDRLLKDVKTQKEKIITLKGIKHLLKTARQREDALDYDAAIIIWEDLGELKEAARVRKLQADMGSVKVSQKVVHGDEVNKTKIKDSVVSKSSIGGGSSKMQELEKLTGMKKEGLIDDDEFKQMKKEILGK